jgi:hypothetical protein
MHHVWAATAAAVITVGTTAVSAGMQSSAAGKAAKAQGAAAKKAQKQQNKALKAFQEGKDQIESDIGQIQAPVMDIGADIKEAERITGYNISQLDRMYGGQYKNLQDLAVRAINDRLSGQMTQAARGATMRESAYMQGAGFNPATARAGAIAQRGPFDYLRAIGQSAEQAVTQGFNMMGDWSRTAAGFIANPLAVSQQRLAYGIGGADVGLKKAGIRSDLLAAQFGAQTGISKRQYEMQQENIATSTAAANQRAAMVQGIGQSVASGVSGAGNAYSQYATAANASTTPMDSGFYKGEIGAANAMNVAPSQISYQKPTGGFLGIGGQKGGFYYNPSGPYGR